MRLDQLCRRVKTFHKQLGDRAKYTGDSTFETRPIGEDDVQSVCVSIPINEESTLTEGDRDFLVECFDQGEEGKGYKILDEFVAIYLDPKRPFTTPVPSVGQPDQSTSVSSMKP